MRVRQLIVGVALLLASSIAAAQIPSIDWAACGPSRSGSTWGASCGFDIPVNTEQGIGSYTVADFTFYKGKPANKLGSGVNVKAREYHFGKWDARLDLLTTAGVTTTSSATSFNLAGGLYGSITYGSHWNLGVGYRGLTGSTGGRIYNLGLGYSWGKP